MPDKPRQLLVSIIKTTRCEKCTYDYRPGLQNFELLQVSISGDREVLR